MNYTDNIKVVIYVYISYFFEGYVKGIKLLLNESPVKEIKHVNNKESLIFINNKGKEFLINYNNILSDDNINFKELFLKYRKGLYNSYDNNFNNSVDKILLELKK